MLPDPSVPWLWDQEKPSQKMPVTVPMMSQLPTLASILFWDRTNLKSVSLAQGRGVTMSSKPSATLIFILKTWSHVGGGGGA